MKGKKPMSKKSESRAEVPPTVERCAAKVTCIEGRESHCVDYSCDGECLLEHHASVGSHPQPAQPIEGSAAAEIPVPPTVQPKKQSAYREQCTVCETTHDNGIAYDHEFAPTDALVPPTERQGLPPGWKGGPTM